MREGRHDCPGHTPFLVPFVSHTEVTLLFLYHKSIAKNRQLCVLLFWRLEVQEWVTLLGRPLYHYKVGKEKEKCEEAGLTVISPPSPGNLISDPQPVLGAPLWANHLSMAGYAKGTKLQQSFRWEAPNRDPAWVVRELVQIFNHVTVFKVIC